MIPYIDAHCDTITRLAEKNQSLAKNDGHIDLARLWEAGCAVQVFAMWLDPYYYPRPLRQTLCFLDYYRQELRENSDSIVHVNTSGQLDQNLRTGRVSALLSLEGGEALEGEIPVLRTLFELGVRAMNLTWNNRNLLGVPAVSDTGDGLTAFGQDVVREMNLLGMAVDVSHLNEAGFWDVERLSHRPFYASHSNARAVCDHRRNLTDDQLRALAAHGGVAGLNLYPAFVKKTGPVDAEDLLRHLEHMIQVGGEDLPALGTDFDGIETTPKGLEDVTGMPAFLEMLAGHFGPELTEKIAYRNMLRFWGQVLPR